MLQGGLQGTRLIKGLASTLHCIMDAKTPDKSMVFLVLSVMESNATAFLLKECPNRPKLVCTRMSCVTRSVH